MTRRQTYWICQLGGWSALMGLAVFSQTSLDRIQLETCLIFLTVAEMGLLTTHFYRRWIQRRGWLKLPLRPLLARILAGVLVLGSLLTLAGIPLSYLGGERETALGSLKLVAQFANWAFIILVWSSLYFGIHWLEDLQRMRVEKWRLEAVVKEAELKALKDQLNPHFLFNCLNDLRGLMAEDLERAQAMVTQLAGLLRYALRTGDATTVPVEEEIRIVRYYVDLEAVRLEERLRVGWDIEGRTLTAQVPPMLIQSLVENAIKHGISKRARGGRLNISARRDGHDLAIRVRNTGQTSDEPSTEGTGLENAAARLKLIFGDAASLRLRNLNEEEVQVELDIPFQEGQAS